MRRKTKSNRDFAILSIEAAGEQRTRIVLNGTDISKQCRKITFTHEAGKTPTVSVELYVDICDCLLEHQAFPVTLVCDDEQANHV